EVSLAGSPRGENRLDELVRDFGRNGRRIVRERTLAELHRFFVARQILPAVGAQTQVVLERGAAVRRQFAGQIVGDEVGELAAGHDGATSQKILMAPFGSCKRSKSSW